MLGRMKRARVDMAPRVELSRRLRVCRPPHSSHRSAPGGQARLQEMHLRERGEGEGGRDKRDEVNCVGAQKSF